MRGLSAVETRGSVAPQHVETSQTRDQTRVPFINRQILTHWSCYLLFTRNEIETLTERLACLKVGAGTGTLASDYSSRLCLSQSGSSHSV